MIEILIPTFNRKNFLKKCIQSITCQKNYENFFKILVIDNCSNDGTDLFLKNLKINNLKFIINDKNLGVEANIINCLKKCSEEFVMIMSDDDLLCKNSINVLKKTFHDFKDISTISSPSFIFKDKTKEILNIFYEKRFSSESKIFYEKNYALKNLLLRATFMSGLIIKKTNIDLSNIYKHNNSYYPQLYVWGNAICKGNNIFLKKPFIFAREENKKNWDYDKNYFNSGVMNIINDICIHNNIKNKIRKKIIFQRIKVSYNFLLNEKRKSFKNFIKVFFNHLQIKEYRQSVLFHIYFFLILLFGEKFYLIGKFIKNKIK